MIIESRAYARAGLLGNPSDGYFGKTISFIVRNFGAHISLYETPELKVEVAEKERSLYRNIYHFYEDVSQTGYYGGDRLVKAAIKKFFEYCQESQKKLHTRNFTVRYRSSIPRQVGLAGSSAIVTATMRALCTFYGIKIKKEIMPNLVLSAETEELGIKAGLQDRVIQVYEGCMYMDFDSQSMQERGYGRYIALDPGLLPNIYIAYKTDLSKVSGTMFNDLRERYDRGDQQTRDTLQEIASLADEGKRALQEHDYEALHALINRNFDLRRNIINIDDNNLRLVEVARDCGASAKFPGSGGSIVGTYPSEEVLKKLIIEMNKLKVRVIKPFIS